MAGNSKIECKVCKVKISYVAGSTNSLYRHNCASISAVGRKKTSEPAANESASLSTATTAAAAAAAAAESTVHHHNHLDLQPELYDSLCKAMFFKIYLFVNIYLFVH